MIPPDRTGPGMCARSGRAPFLYAAAVCLITLATYLPAVRNGFVWWDDDYYVFNNAGIRELNAAFISWAFCGFHVGNWHPLTWISHAVDYAVWGLDPAGHHLTSVLLHCLNTLLVFLVIHKMFHLIPDRGMPWSAAAGQAGHEESAIAGLTALFFGIHPVHVESVAWVSERKDLLCALFFLLSLLFYLRHIERYRSETTLRPDLPLTRDYAASFTAFLCALLSKSMAVTLPAVLLLLDIYLSRRFTGATARQRIAIVLEKAPFALASLAISVITVRAQQATIQPLDNVTLEERILVAAHSFCSYIGMLVWPMNLAHYHPYPATAFFTDPAYAGSLVVSIAIIAAAWHFRTAHPIAFLAAASFSVMLLPVLGFVQVGEQARADRFLYLPSIGPLALAATGAYLVMLKLPFPGPLRQRMHLPALAAVLLVGAAFVPLSLQQITVWRDDVTLWTRTIDVYADKDPKDYHHMERLFHDRAAAFQRTGQFERALADLDRAITISPDTPELYRDRGFLSVVMGKPDQSMRDYETARRLEERDRFYRQGR